MKKGSRFDELLTLLFMALFVAAVVCYFVLGSENPTYFILGGIAIVMRVAQYILRLF